MTDTSLLRTEELMQKEPAPYRLIEVYELSKKDRLAAIAAYEELSSDGSVLAKLYLGYVYRGLGEAEKAVFWFDKAYQAGSVEGALHLGLFKAKDGRWAEAKQFFEMGTKYGDPICMYNFADAIIAIGKKEDCFDKIEELYKTSMELGSLRAKNRLAFLYMGGARGLLWRMIGVILYISTLCEVVVVAFRDPQSRRLW